MVLGLAEGDTSVSSSISGTVAYQNPDIVDIVTVVCAGSVAYGLHLAVASMTIYFSLRELHKGGNKLLCAYTVLLITLGSLNYFFSMVYSFVYRSEQRVVLFGILPVVAALLVAICCNGLLMYRCFIVWNQNKLVLILPICLMFAALVSGSLHISQYGDIDSLHGTVLIVYWSLTFCLNILLTSLISGRILRMRSTIRKLMGKEFAEMYGGRLSILVESALLYTLVTLAGVPVMYVGTAGYAFSPVLVQTECIASELIILRVVLGRAIPKISATSTGWSLTNSTGISVANESRRSITASTTYTNSDANSFRR